MDETCTFTASLSELRRTPAAPFERSGRSYRVLGRVARLQLHLASLVPRSSPDFNETCDHSDMVFIVLFIICSTKRVTTPSLGPALFRSAGTSFEAVKQLKANPSVSRSSTQVPKPQIMNPFDKLDCLALPWRPQEVAGRPLGLALGAGQSMPAPSLDTAYDVH